jgi:hypothetical protein
MTGKPRNKRIYIVNIFTKAVKIDFNFRPIKKDLSVRNNIQHMNGGHFLRRHASIRKRQMRPLPPRGKEAQSLPVPRNGRDECGPTMPRPFTGGGKSKILEAAACHKPLTAVSIISRTIA